MTDGSATSRGWRTAPLIGLRFARTLPARRSRRASIEDAILAHDGEAQAAADAFRALSAGRSADAPRTTSKPCEESMKLVAFARPRSPSPPAAAPTSPTPSYKADVVTEHARLDRRRPRRPRRRPRAICRPPRRPAAAGTRPTDAAAIAAMKDAWKRRRIAYEHVEGATAPIFPDVDVSMDARYDDFLAMLGADRRSRPVRRHRRDRHARDRAHPVRRPTIPPGGHRLRDARCPATRPPRSRRPTPRRWSSRPSSCRS